MKDIAELALDVAVSSGANYADCRVVQRGVQALSVKDGSFAAVSSFEDEGVGIRVIVDGAWGFAGVDRLDFGQPGRGRPYRLPDRAGVLAAAPPGGSARPLPGGGG